MQCPSCDHVASQTEFGEPARCPDCGIYVHKALKLQSASVSKASAANEPASSEKVFFEAANVKVTSARFIAHGQTFAMSSVNSVKMATIDKTPAKTPQGWMIGLGGLSTLGMLLGKNSDTGILLGSIALTAAGIFWWISAKPVYEYRLVLTTSSGEVNVLTSHVASDIRKVEAALNDAIVYRG